VKRYSIKCRSGKIEYFDVISESDDGYQVRLTRISDGNEKTNDVFMPNNLFEMCFKTGYIYEMDHQVRQVTVA